MEILIPVTKVFNQKKVECQTYSQMDEGMKRERAKTQKPFQLGLKSQNSQLLNKKYRAKSNRVHIKNQDYGNRNYQNSIHDLQRLNEDDFNSKVPTFIRHHGKIDCSMQKKSTQSSLHETKRQQNIEIQHPHQVSSAIMMISKGQIIQKEKEEKNLNFQLQKDEFNQDLQKSCKICLGGDNPAQSQSNPLVRVCKCHDYVHGICLQEWINHRNVLHGSSRINQCQVCRQLYHFELCTEGFLSLEIFKKKAGSKPLISAFKFLLVLALFIFAVSCIYLFIELLAQEAQNGGYVQSTLKVPYGTCLVIMILISIVGVLVFIIMAHNFVTTLCLDFQYKIGKITEQNSKQSSRNLNNIDQNAR